MTRCPDCETDTDIVELYDPKANRWMPTSPIRLVVPDGGDADQLSGLTALSGGQVLATGANDSGALYDPGTEAWTSFVWKLRSQWPNIDRRTLGAIGWRRDRGPARRPCALRWRRGRGPDRIS